MNDVTLDQWTGIVILSYLASAIIILYIFEEL